MENTKPSKYVVPAALNVFRQPIVPCSFDPMTGFFRDGCCKTDQHDLGSHLVCAVMTKEFLVFSYQRGNDLTTPRPEYVFPGLRPGESWCLCALRWKEAFDAGCAPKVKLESTHVHVLDLVTMEVLQEFAYTD